MEEEDFNKTFKNIYIYLTSPKANLEKNELSMKNEFTHIDVQLYMNYYKIN